MIRPNRLQAHPGNCRRIAIGLVCLASVAAGCAHKVHNASPPTFSRYRAPDFDFYGIRRVVVLPAENQTRYPDAAEQFRANLANELRSAGLFEVVELPVYNRICPSTAGLQGTFPEQLLVDLAKQFQAEAVLFVNVNEYHPYSPPKLGATVHLVSTHEAIALASVDGMWDARDGALAAEAQGYYHQLSQNGSLPRRELVLHSPDLFQRFVARKIVAALSAQ